MVWNVSILIRLIIYFLFVFIFVLIFAQCAQCTQRALGCWSKAHKRDTSSPIAAAPHLWAFQCKKQTNLKDSLYQHFTRKYCTNKWNIIFICKTISTMPLCAYSSNVSIELRIFNKSTFGLPWGWQFNCRASISLVDVSACHLTVSPDYHIPHNDLKKAAALSWHLQSCRLLATGLPGQASGTNRVFFLCDIVLTEHYSHHMTILSLAGMDWS